MVIIYDGNSPVAKTLLSLGVPVLWAYYTVKDNGEYVGAGWWACYYSNSYSKTGNMRHGYLREVESNGPGTLRATLFAPRAQDRSRELRVLNVPSHLASGLWQGMVDWVDGDGWAPSGAGVTAALRDKGVHVAASYYDSSVLYHFDPDE